MKTITDNAVHISNDNEGETEKLIRNLFKGASLPDNQLRERYVFRDILPREADQAVRIEQICFPPHEACSEKMMLERIKEAPEMLMVAQDRKTGKIAGFLSGLATDESVFRDEFFTDAGLHQPAGDTVMLLGLDVLPEYRGQGLAREIMFEYFCREYDRGRRTIILTCLDEKVSMYKKMGYEDQGMSASVWGGERWHDMVCKLPEL